MEGNNITENKQHRRRGWLRLLLWTIFGMGLLVQALAPRLKIANHTFVIPQAPTSRSEAINPGAIIARERVMQLISAILTVSGALGLGLYYRHVLVRPRSI